MMLIANRNLNHLQIGLAQYYLTKLRKLEAAYHQGHEHSHDALAHFDKDWPQIQHWYKWAAGHIEEDIELARLCMAFSEAGLELLRLRQHPQERLDWLETGLMAAKMLHEQDKEMAHLYLLARVHLSLTNLELAQDYSEKALAIAKKLKDKLYVSRILVTSSNILYKIGDYPQALEAAREALQLFKSLGAKHETGAALNALANAEASQSDYQASYEHCFEYLAISEFLGHPHDICLALHNLSNVSDILGMDREARAYAKRCLELARQTGNLFQQTTILGILGYFACEDNLIEEGQAYLQESLEVALLAGLPDEELHAWGRIGNLRMLLGDYEGALEAYEAALALSKQGAYLHFRILALGSLEQAYRHLGKVSLALEKLREGIELILNIQMPSIQVVYLQEVAQLWYLQGKNLEAAEFVGIVEEHPEEFDKKDWQDFLNLAQGLEEKLGTEAFHAAKQEGKSANLEELLQDIYEQLG